MADWTFLTHHTRVLLCITRQPGVRLRDIAQSVQITERTTHRIVSELVEARYVTRHRVGPRSFYEVHPELPLRHELDSEHQIGDILTVLLPNRANNDNHDAAGSFADTTSERARG